MLFRFSIFLLFFGKYMCCVLNCFGMSNSVTPRAGAHQAPLSMGILQATILEWVAMPSSRGTFPTQGSSPGFPRCRRIHYL